jgi:hypothetical protein
MKTVTPEAIAQCNRIPDVLRHFLSEAPTGDEYETLTPAELALGNAFVEYLAEQHIDAFEQRCSPERTSASGEKRETSDKLSRPKRQLLTLHFWE